jgi:thioesterase domain-containing protein/acyl carrier protein
MVPTFFEVLANLPLLLNGKLDRRSLRPPTSTAPLSVSPDAVPLTSAECVVAKVWRELLGVDSIGRDTSFFELGGDSLRAAQVMSRLSEAAGASLAVRSIFEFPTVAGLAKILESHDQLLAPEARGSRAAAGAEPAQPVEAMAKQSDADSGKAFASGELETVLADIWRSVLGTATGDIDADFFEIGGHSLLAVRLVWEVESRLGVALPPASLFQHGTIRKQAQLLREPGSELSWSPLVAIQPNGAKPPLFLVHGIGGEVLSYGPLATHLGQDQPLYGLRARANVESGASPSVEEMAASYVAAVRRQCPGPYHIGGYSGGGLIAYEMAQQLRRAGQQVSLLLLDCSAPNSFPATRPSLRDCLGLFVRAVHWFSDDDLLRAGSAVALGRLRSKVFGVVSAVARRMSPRHAPEHDIRHELGLWRYPDDSREFLAQLNQALRAYRPAPYPGSLTVVRARSRRLWSLRGMPEDLGWRPRVGGRVTTELVPAAHDTLVTEPRVRRVAIAVRRHLQSDRSCGEAVDFQPTGELAAATRD